MAFHKVRTVVVGYIRQFNGPDATWAVCRLANAIPNFEDHVIITKKIRALEWWILQNLFEFLFVSYASNQNNIIEYRLFVMLLKGSNGFLDDLRAKRESHEVDQASIEYLRQDDSKPFSDQHSLLEGCEKWICLVRVEQAGYTS